MSQGERQRFDEKSQNKNASALTIDHIEMLPPKTMCFEELCPQWSLALISGVSINPYLDIEKGKYCIVGEAHGFRNSAYICSKCWEYSQSFVSSVLGNRNSGYIITDYLISKLICSPSFKTIFLKSETGCPSTTAFTCLPLTSKPPHVSKNSPNV